MLQVLCASAAPLSLANAARATSPPARDIVALAAARTSSTFYKATARGALRSTDCRSWHDMGLRLPAGARIDALTVSSVEPTVVYAAGRGIGVMRSTDGGARWNGAGRGLPSRVTAIAAHAKQADTVYAYAPSHGVYRSEDAGRAWRLMDAGPRGGIVQFAHSDMPGSMQTGWLFAAGSKGVRLSMDCFCGWRGAGDLVAPAHSIACDPRNPAHVAAAMAEAVFESTDGGQAWSKLPDTPVPIAALVFGSDGRLHAAGGTHLYRLISSGWEALDA